MVYEVLQPLIQSPVGYLLYFTFIIVITHIFAQFFRRFVALQYERKTLLHLTQNQYVIIQHFVIAFIYIFGFGFAIYLVPPLRSLSISMFAGAGVLAIIVGFASQSALSNLVSGLFIAMFKPFRAGDQIKIIQTNSEVFGIVDDISLRHTIIRTFDNKHVIIPNSVITTQTIINYTLDTGKGCEYVEVVISYDSDLVKAIKVLEETCEAHPDVIDIRSPHDVNHGVPKVIVRALAFEDYGVRLRANVWAQNARKAFIVHCELNISIKKAFDKHKIKFARKIVKLN
jgi:small conductance mechanosensitive channel